MESKIENSLVLGTAQLGMPYGIANKRGQPDQETALHIIKEAWDGGIRQFDSAQAYGVSEAVLGRAFNGLGYGREALVISKFNPNLNHLDEKTMSKALDESLERLCVPKLFGMLLHREELLSLWPNGLGEILRGFVSAKKVKHIGISVYSPEKALEAIKTEGIDILQVPANILDRRFDKGGIFEQAQDMNKRIYVRSVFLQGLIFMTEEDLPKKMQVASLVIRQIETLAEKMGLEKDEMALAYLKHKIPQAYIIFGAESPEQVRRSISSWKRRTELDVVTRIENGLNNVDEFVLRPDLWSK